MPHKNKHTTRVINEAAQFWLAMLDLLPVTKWHELRMIVEKTHYWEYDLRTCTNFTVDE